MNFRFIFVVVCVMAMLFVTVYVRSKSNHLHYEFCKITLEQNRLRQVIASKQLRLQNLINPASAL